MKVLTSPEGDYISYDMSKFVAGILEECESKLKNILKNAFLSN